MNKIDYTVREYLRPDDLSGLGNKAYDIIMSFIKKHELDCGGCKTFYSPEEWRKREEEYCTGSELIIVYDGGGLWDVIQGGMYNLEEELINLLNAEDLFCESGTSWYAGVYEI